MIEVHDVRKQFGDVKALGGVSFSARDGHITALLGPNGAGKTTLLRTLVGLLKRDHGTIAIDGVDPERDPLAVRRNIGFLTDQFGLYERLSTREYLAYFGELNGLGGSALTARIDEVSELLSMDDILERRTKGFSQGQRIKVALARTLLHRPRNLLLDEPSRGLDVMSTRALRRALTALRADGCCVIMATHVMQEVTHLCDDVIVIAKGHTVAQGSPTELCRRTGIENLEDAFVSLVGEEGIAA
ncbi:MULTISPECIES: ATP-binding cassette domain-containing protein [unclassified Massilia]|uniref:ABC transporter ATP-binding protein n=1 Tax=unclassified Massilia TaxID=2609279 RepID=UPI00177A938A|nr:MULTISPECIES: ATP-binding cassette domain-containing protein [unclassified Massilia]MBD8530641.1 ATP-binding cassette domain-containing protein [Massilia sp. CFBP 13647]MBD8674866.1 ATP-binding cassette domain-containing protein [Massilia sp. CFBP 13721]